MEIRGETIMKTVWTEISCEVPLSMVDLLADFLVELSGNGVSIENLYVDTFSVDTIEDSPLKTVKAYFETDQCLEEHIQAIGVFLHGHGAEFADFVYKNPVVKAIDAEDWANNWKKHFKPVRIGSRLVIKPTWEEYTPNHDDIILQLDPGMAFGTGAHPTTKMCLEVLENIFWVRVHSGANQRLYRLPFWMWERVPVLSIAAAKLGASHIFAIDIDPDAVIVAEENVALNDGLAVVSLSTTPLQEVAGEFMIVLANILAEELVRLSQELVIRVAAAGFLILSGILTEKEGFVMEGFSPYGLTLVEIRREGEWSCITLQKGSR